MKKCGVLLLIIASLYSFRSITFSQISLTGSGSYSQDFNTLADTGSSSVLPTGWYLFESGTGADSEYVAGTGGSTSGNTYSFGSSDSNGYDRALGGIRITTLVPSFGAYFINNTGDVISLLHITYTGEQWRAGKTDRDEADRLDFQYSLTAAGLSDTGWIDVDQLDFHSPNLNTNSGAKDGNSTENRTGITHTITGISIPDGAEFWIKWIDADVSGSDDGLAIDDFEIDLTAPAVTFSMSPASLNFDTVGVGNSSTLSVTVENLGTTDDLEITDAVSSNPAFTFLPNTFPITVAPGGSEVFDVTFLPVVDGPETGTIVFTHNAGSPTILSLSGTGQALGQSGLLKFKSHIRDLLDGTKGNQDTIVLSGYSGQPLKALQFNLLIGKTNGGLILRSVQRGLAIPAGQFNFSYEIYQGDFLPDGSSIDTVKVVILGNSTNAIMPDTGSQEILKFSYDIVSISGVSDQTFIGLFAVSGATDSPVSDANITAGTDEIINIFNGTLEGLLGDVNLDDQVNILDILLMIDYMLGRIEFNSEQFFNGDISPWIPGDPLPSRDGKIDVLDLAVVQNIVLIGAYPSGTPVYKKAINSVEFATNGLPKLTPGMNAKVIFYLTSEGIAVSLESVKKIKGIQLELNELRSLIPENTIITSIFDQALCYQDNSFLRMLSYDGKSDPLKSGEYLLASIPFTLISPEDIIVENVLIADENNNAIQKVEIEIRYENPGTPLDYMLSQNYPNPFNPSTLVRFSIPKDEFVTIKIYDMIGQEITTLFSDNTKAGIYTINWDGIGSNGNQLSSGSYILRMTAGEFVQSKKMMYIK